MAEIIIFGTGVDGRRIFRYEKLQKKNRIVAFIENDKKKVGKTFFDTPIISPNSLKNSKFFKKKIFLGGRYMDDQHKQLINLKINPRYNKN